MAAPYPRRTFSATEYLRLERKAETRSEFWAGETFALADVSREHKATVLNCAAELQNRCHMERSGREEGGSWRFSEHKERSETLTLERIGCTLLLQEVYDKGLGDTQP